MAIRRPLVRVNGRTQELPAGDTLPGELGDNSPENPVFVHVVNDLDTPQDAVFHGTAGTVSIPLDGRSAVVSAIAPVDGAATVQVASEPPITIPAARNFSDTFRFTAEGPYDIVFTGTEAYYVRYFTSDYIPAEMVQV